ncbi:MAG: hypothetical protein U0133_17950 [Gemmatimonadales bacterium]
MLPRSALAALLVLSVAGDAAGPRDILGTWYGSSICVKTPDNAACNDETVRYQFAVKGADSTLVHQVADKLVNGQWDLMGELDYRWDAGAHEWNGDFENTRVKIRWTCRVSHDTLTGEVVVLPGRRIARHVVAVRMPPPGRP